MSWRCLRSAACSIRVWQKSLQITISILLTTVVLIQSLNNLNPLSIMKTRNLLAAALALPMLFACNKENITPSLEGKGFDFSVTVSSDEDTKAVFDDTKGILWVNPGSAGLVTSKDSDVVVKKSTAANPSEDGRQSTFKFENITAGNYRLFYPYQETNYPNIKFTVPANQTQDASGQSSDIFAGMATEDVTAADGENNIKDVKYQTVGSYIQFRVYGNAGEKVRNVSIVSSGDIAGDYLVDASNYKYTMMGGGSNRVSVALGDAGYTTTANFESSTGIYAAVRPGTYTNTYYVTTDEAIYEFKSNNQNTFAEGSIKSIKLNLQSEKENVKKYPVLTVPTELYIVGDVTYVGWNLANAKIMEKNGNVFSIDVYLSTTVKNDDNTLKDAEGFKFLTQTNDWAPCYVNDGTGKLVYRSWDNEVPDTKFTVDKAGYYHVEADFTTGVVTCTPKAPKKLYVWGAATEAGWDSGKAIELTKSKENEFVFTAELFMNGGQDFKFFSDHSEYTAYVNDGSGNLVFFDSPSYTDADKKFNLGAFGLYTLTVDLSAGTVKTESGDLYLLGDCFGWDVNYGKQMTKVSEGVYEISKLRFPTSDVSNKFKFAFKKGDNIEFAFSVIPEKAAEYGINFTKEYNDRGEGKTNSAKKDELENVSSVKIIANFADDAFEFGNGDGKWFIVPYFCDKIYDFKLDLNEKTLTASLSQGSDFWLVGINGVWQESNIKATAGDDGIARWTDIEVKTGTAGWDGTFKIRGENVLPDNFWAGEWYHSNISWDWDDSKNQADYYWWTGSTYGQTANVVFEKTSDRKWHMAESGTYDFEFDTKNLTLKVTKK